MVYQRCNTRAGHLKPSPLLRLLPFSHYEKYRAPFRAKNLQFSTYTKQRTQCDLFLMRMWYIRGIWEVQCSKAQLSASPGEVRRNKRGVKTTEQESPPFFRVASDTGPYPVVLCHFKSADISYNYSIYIYPYNIASCKNIFGKFVDLSSKVGSFLNEKITFTGRIV